MGVTVVAPWFATTLMDRVIWEVLSAGALDVEGCTTLESTPRSPTSSTGWRHTPLLCLLTLLQPCQQPPCLLPPSQQPPCQQLPCLLQPCQQPPCHAPLCPQLNPQLQCLVQP